MCGQSAESRLPIRFGLQSARSPSISVNFAFNSAGCPCPSQGLAYKGQQGTAYNVVLQAEPRFVILGGRDCLNRLRASPDGTAKPHSERGKIRVPGVQPRGRRRIVGQTAANGLNDVGKPGMAGLGDFVRQFSVARFAIPAVHSYN